MTRHKSSKKKISVYLLILYSFLSLVVPHFKPIAVFEASGLLFLKPWDSLKNLFFFPHGQGDASALLKNAAPRSDQWWRDVFDVPESAKTYSLVGLRALHPIQQEQTRINYYCSALSSIEPGDPVVVGPCLAGFVNKVIKGPLPQVQVFLLRDQNAPRISGLVRGSVAGGSIGFLAGGASSAGERDIDLNIPFTRYGLNQGCLVKTAADPQFRTTPSDLLIGTIRISASKEREYNKVVSIIPSLSPDQLNRVAALVPMSRAPDRKNSIVPPFPVIPVNIRARMARGGQRFRPHLRLSSGVEKGLSKGDVVVVNSNALARVSKSGLYGSHCDLLLALKESRHAAMMDQNNGPVFFQMEAVQGSMLRFKVKSDRKLTHLTRGAPIFLNESPCSGLGAFPVFFVEDPGDGLCFTVSAYWSENSKQHQCLRFRGEN